MYNARITVSSTGKIYGDGIEFDSLSEINSWSGFLKKTGKIQENDFVLEVKNLLEDENYIRQQIRESRRREYPKLEDIIEALMENLEGRPEKLQEVLTKRVEVKNKYPLPEKKR